MTVIFVVATILIFLGIDWIARTARERKAATVPAGVPLHPYPIRVPEGIFFTRSHMWLNLFPSGKVRLGIDDFIGRVVEQPEIVLLKKEGERIHRGEPIMLMRENQHILTVRSPIEGQIESTNDELRRHPELLHDELFSEGWAYTIVPQKFSDLKGLLLGNETREWMRTEFARLRDFFAGVTQTGQVAPAYLQDGGPPMAGIMRNMSDEVWQNFETEFLTNNDEKRN